MVLCGPWRDPVMGEWGGRVGGTAGSHRIWKGGGRVTYTRARWAQPHLSITL